MFIHVKVQPGARREEFKEVEPEHFTALVKEPAERNLANRRVAELLARHYTIAPSAVRLISGHHSQSKIFDIKK